MKKPVTKDGWYHHPLLTLTMLYNALIRTHHITSRKKVAALKRAADTHQCFVLLRSGGSPGIMYVEGQARDDVEAWVGEVRKLRYKDFQLVTKPELLAHEETPEPGQQGGYHTGVEEVESVKEFGSVMARKGVWNWWRRGMGYTS